MRSKLVAAIIGAAMVLGPVSALAATQPKGNGQAAAPATVNWQIPLSASRAYARATGSAQYQAQSGQCEFQVEVERLASLRGTSLLVRVNGGSVGSMRVSSTGVAQLTRNSERGLRVPLITHGSTVTVKTTTGALISSGRF